MTARLRAAGCVAAEEEAVELVAASSSRACLEAFLDRREQGEPLAWITGTVEFCGAAVHVDDGVYVPRRQTEELARRAAALLPASGGRAADLCTGTGAVAMHLQETAPSATVVGVDIDAAAVACARRNGVRALQGHLADPLRGASFDVLTAVAPYVPTGEMRLLPADVQRYEPRRALDGGADGLDVVRSVVAAAAEVLRSGGWLLIELGGEQDEIIEPQLTDCGFAEVSAWFDQDGDLRGLAARLC